MEEESRNVRIDCVQHCLMRLHKLNADFNTIFDLCAIKEELLSRDYSVQYYNVEAWMKTKIWKDNLYSAAGFERLGDDVIDYVQCRQDNLAMLFANWNVKFPNGMRVSASAVGAEIATNGTWVSVFQSLVDRAKNVCEALDEFEYRIDSGLFLLECSKRFSMWCSEAGRAPAGRENARIMEFVEERLPSVENADKRTLRSTEDMCIETPNSQTSGYEYIP